MAAEGVERRYLFPVVVLLAAAGMTENQALARAIAFVCAGGVLPFLVMTRVAERGRAG